MGATRIEWTDKTWNPVSGCSKCSPGCTHCYAERMAKRLAGRYGYPADEPFKVTLHPDRLEEPLRWKKPRMIFAVSMGDLFHEAVPFEFIDQVFATMALSQQHTFQVLTKRPQRMKEWVGTVRERRPIPGQGVSTGGSPFCMGKYCTTHDAKVGYCGSPWPLPNVWLGVTVENQEEADKRIPLLLQTPAAVRFVSVEPMLGPVGIAQYMDPLHHSLVLEEWPADANGYYRTLDWVICGGETGPGARPMHPDWVRSLRDQCDAAGVSFFFKQWGAWFPRLNRNCVREQDAGALKPYTVTSSTNRKEVGSTVYYAFPSQLKLDEYGLTELWRMERVGKKAAGHLLDGREWRQMPEVQSA